MSTVEIRLTVNGSEVAIRPGSTVRQLLELLGITHTAVAVEIDTEICPRDQIDARVLKSGEVIEVVSLVGGG